MRQTEAIGTDDGVVTPALLLNLDAFERNIFRMRDLVAASGRRYRPHVKSHKSVYVARQQMAAGACGLCCATVVEVAAMVDGGIDDILVTSPIAEEIKARRLARLAERARIAVVVDHAAQAAMLAHAAAVARTRIEVFIEVDVGQGRCGVRPGAEAASLARKVAAHAELRLAGLQGYNGAIQMRQSYRERAAAVRQSLDLLLLSRDAVRAAGIEVSCLTGGGTGTLPIDLALGGLDELQPGSYAVMDGNYTAIEGDEGGNAPLFEGALTVLTTVISRPAPDRAIVDAGWKSISSDGGTPRPQRSELTFEFAGDEHGMLRAANGHLPEIGERVELVPSHCDTTVNLYDEFIGVRDGNPGGAIPIEARGKT